MLLIPFLGEETGSIKNILSIFGKSVFILGSIFIAGLYVFPFIFHQIVKTKIRELFLMTVLVLSLGTAYLSYKLGLSLALGTFLAGMVISESEYSLQTIAEIKPFKDLLMAIFFYLHRTSLKTSSAFLNLTILILVFILLI